jgi:hypothetical protein
MPKKPNIPTLTGGYASAAALNANFQAILDALDNTLSRDGSTPNQMESDLDLNGNSILNASVLETDDLVVDGMSVSEILSQLESAIETLGNVDNIDDELQTALTQLQALKDETEAELAVLGFWRGNWTGSTVYNTGDRVHQGGNAYIALSTHTSNGTFGTDLSAGRWQLYAAKGIDGLGAGDVVAANNLSDLDDPAEALANLSGQPLNAQLTALAALATSGLVARTGAGTLAARTLTGTANQITVTNGNGASGNPTVAAVVASQAEAEAGSDNTKLMTPLRVAQALSSSQGSGLETVQNTTSGTAFDFTGLPAGVTEVDVIFENVSLSGTDNLLIQLGTSSGFTTSGYTSQSIFVSSSNVGVGSTNGLIVVLASAPRAINGVLRLRKITGNTWVSDHSGQIAGVSAAILGGGTVSLSGALDRIRLTRTNTNTFDSGRVNIKWRI